MVDPGSAYQCGTCPLPGRHPGADVLAAIALRDRLAAHEGTRRGADAWARFEAETTLDERERWYRLFDVVDAERAQIARMRRSNRG